MRLANKEFLKRVFVFILFYLGFGVLPGNVLTANTIFTNIFLLLMIPYLIIIPIARRSVSIYLLATNHLLFLAFICLLSAICFTLLSPCSAVYYYGLLVPDNYIALAFCTLPFIALLIHMLHKGCKSLDEIAEAYIQKQSKRSINDIYSCSI